MAVKKKDLKEGKLLVATNTLYNGCGFRVGEAGTIVKVKKADVTPRGNVLVYLNEYGSAYISAGSLRTLKRGNEAATARKKFEAQ